MPSLLIFSEKDFQLISTNGRGEIETLGKDALKKWSDQLKKNK